MCNVMASIPSSALLTVSRESDFLPKLAAIDIRPPPSGEGRTHIHEERWSICHLLSSMTGDSRLRFPLAAVHDDKPDFRLQSGEHRIGVEVTRATHPDYAWALDLADKVDGGLVECSSFRPGSAARQARIGSKPPISNVQRGLHGRGWLGAEPERDWVEFASRAIEDKSEKLIANKRYDLDWLLIRDATPCKAVLHHDVAVAMLQESLSAYWPRSQRFAAIFVLSGCHVFEFCPGGTRSRSVLKLWN